ncbi:TPA: integrase, partial [Klebsiella pneumoniae]|nr:integrase [Klebsiella pneumoniae]
LRFYSLKGYGADIKWIPDVMVPVARRAIERLKKLSKNAREFAQWVEENPSTFFRRDSLPETGENEILKPWQICEGLGYNLERKSGNVKFLSGVSFYNSQKSYTMNSLWEIILSRLPESFPWYDKNK